MVCIVPGIADAVALSLHDALPISRGGPDGGHGGDGGSVWLEAIDDSSSLPRLVPRHLHRAGTGGQGDRKSTRLKSSHVAISYAVFCLKQKKLLHIQKDAH